MNKSFLSLTLFFLLSLSKSISFGQLAGWQDKVSWSYSVEKISDSEAYIVATAKLIKGWHVFSVNHDPDKADFTGYPTTFKFKPNKNYKLIGKTIDGKKADVHKDELGVSLYFEGAGVFKQKIEVLTEEKFDISFDYSFQICDENGCLFPPDQSGKVTISGYKPGASEGAEVPTDLIINGEFAKDKTGKDYVKHNDEWVAVPAGNSPKFYKKYLTLGGTNEN